MNRARRKSAIEAQEREVQAAERMASRSRAKARASLESAADGAASTSGEGMEVKPSSTAPPSPPHRGVKRKAGADDEARPPALRYSPPPIDLDADDETLRQFGQAIGRGPLVARLIWRGLEGAGHDPATHWKNVEEYILFARQRGDQAPFFPAKRVEKYIAKKALDEYKSKGKVEYEALDMAKRRLHAFHTMLGFKWDEEQATATAFVVGGAARAWGSYGEDGRM